MTCRAQRVSALAFPLLAILENLLVQGADEGVFRKKIDICPDIHQHRSASYLSNRYTLLRFFAADLISDEALIQRFKQVAKVVLAYLRPA